MPPTMTRRIPLLVLAFLCVAGNLHSVAAQEEHKEFYALVQTVTDIVAGKNSEQAARAIGSKADLVAGGKILNLMDVVTGGSPAYSLADTSYQGVMIQARTNSSEDMGFILLKTVKSDTTKVRFHSVVFVKDSTGQYRINLWHVSGNE